MNDRILKPEDYAEPRCLLCDEPYGKAPEVKAVPQQRIIEKMNEYMGRADYAGAERHLLYWLEEAELGRDEGGELLIRNELIGHFRKTGNRDKAFLHAERAAELVQKLRLEETVSGGTTFVNIATAFNAFGENERSLSSFEKAAAAYEHSDSTPAELLGGLYNNMALTLSSLGRFEEALSLFEKALNTMEKVENGKLEQAITCLNMADTYNAMLGSEYAEKKTQELTDRAFDLIDSPENERNGYYAFVCEKCAPSFSYYGCFLAAAELNKRAKEIYERT